MPKKDSTKTGAMLMYLLAAKKDFDAVFPKPKQFVKDSVFQNYSDFKNMVYHLKGKGWIQIVEQGDERFIKLTKEGELEALLALAKMPHRGRWDGKWRLVMFDIPEELGQKRGVIRRLLLKNGFLRLQASVFLNPYPLNREAVAYLKETDLLKYIIMMKVEEIDDDSELRKRFRLPAYT